LEHPLTAASWDQAPFRRLVDLSGTTKFPTNMCRHGLRCPLSKRLVYKGTGLLATHAEFRHHLGLLCDRTHEHCPLKDHPLGITWAQVYPVKFCERAIDALIEILDKKAHGALPAVAPEREAAEPPAEAEPPEEQPLGSRAISFGPKAGNLPTGVRNALRRLHVNMGHPANEDLARNLRLRGADPQLFKGAQHLRCQSCRRVQRPGGHRVATSSLPGGFNDEVGLDGIYVRDVSGKAYLYLSVVELSTTYHSAVRLRNRKPSTVASAFRAVWPAGPPKAVRIDMDGMFMKEFQEAMDILGVNVLPAAGQAHWQHGKTERHGGWLKLMLSRVVEHKSVRGKADMDVAVWETCAARNDLRRVCGFSPAEWVFGSSPRLEADLVDGAGALAQHSLAHTSTELARRMAIRSAARRAFVELQNSQALRRALLRKPRVSRLNWGQGDIVFYYRKKNGIEQWRGPAIVIGPAGRANYWLAHGAGTVLASQEQLRSAEDEDLVARPRRRP